MWGWRNEGNNEGVPMRIWLFNGAMNEIIRNLSVTSYPFIQEVA